MNIKEILEYGRNNLIKKEETYRLSKILLKNLLNVDDSYILINSNEEISKEIESNFKNSINQLNDGIPLQYITNKQEFMGLEFYVDENVLIPQPDTEILVEEVINICVGVDAYIDPQKNIKILDLCTGSGAIGISIAKNIENCKMTLSDISAEALRVATQNYNNIVGAHDCVPPDKIKIIHSDLFENIQDKFDIIVSNPPYIKSDIIKTLDKEVQNEPMLALDGGKDGLRYL